MRFPSLPRAACPPGLVLLLATLLPPAARDRNGRDDGGD